MTVRRLSLAVCTLLLFVGTAAAAQTEHFQRTVPLAPGGTVKIQNFSGHVTITATDRSEVAIDAIRRATQDRLDHIKMDVQVSGSTVSIQANKKVDSTWRDNNNVVETDMEIQVPRQTNLDLDVFSSPVKVTGVQGSHRVHTFSATAQLFDVAGPVNAETFSGNIELQLTGAAGRPELNLHTFSGDIDVAMPSSVRAAVDFDSFSGDLKSDLPLTLRTKSRRSLRGEINGAGSDSGTITLKTFSGDVRIKS